MPKKCKACGRNFQPDARVADEQKYCSDPECQRKRRQEWQQTKRRDDPHYRENDVSCQQIRHCARATAKELVEILREQRTE